MGAGGCNNLQKARKTWKTGRNNESRTGPEQGIAVDIAITTASG